MPHPWKHSRSGWMGLWATWSSWRCPCSLQGVRARWPLKVPSNTNHSTILWFYERWMIRQAAICCTWLIHMNEKVRAPAFLSPLFLCLHLSGLPNILCTFLVTRYSAASVQCLFKPPISWIQPFRQTDKASWARCCHDCYFKGILNKSTFHFSLRNLGAQQGVYSVFQSILLHGLSLY